MGRSETMGVSTLVTTGEDCGRASMLYGMAFWHVDYQFFFVNFMLQFFTSMNNFAGGRIKETCELINYPCR